jgi:hypothetical protein
MGVESAIVNECPAKDGVVVLAEQRREDAPWNTNGLVRSTKVKRC